MEVKGDQQFNRVVREDPSEEGPLEQSPDGSEGARHASFGENIFQALETKRTEALSWQHVWFV